MTAGWSSWFVTGLLYSRLQVQPRHKSVDFHDAENGQRPCRMIIRHVKNPLSIRLASMLSAKLNFQVQNSYRQSSDTALWGRNCASKLLVANGIAYMWCRTNKSLVQAFYCLLSIRVPIVREGKYLSRQSTHLLLGRPPDLVPVGDQSVLRALQETTAKHGGGSTEKRQPIASQMFSISERSGTPMFSEALAGLPFVIQRYPTRGRQP
ncbi:hypothetical protein TNCV_1883291 [Trichonephila clavipes]|nr:hypothetical protein TNCV_1883291 [Trichonephila clavipes]